MSLHDKVLLAFSGGLDTSAIIPWLKENCAREIIAYCSDLGNGPNGVELEKWALQLGASQFIFEDLKEQFVSRFAFSAIRAGATYQDDYLLGTALGRPLIAERMAHFARELGATAVAHGCTGKGNDQLRFERSWAYLIPHLDVIAPWRVWSFKGRSDLLKFLHEKGFNIAATDKIYSEDVNLYHRSCEGGILEDPSLEYDPKAIYRWVNAKPDINHEDISVQIYFNRGIPVSINQENLRPADLLRLVNDIAGQAGIGILDLVEERANGIKSRGVYETPGGTLLHAACRALKHLCWDRSLIGTARSLGSQYGECVYDGFWHSDTRRAIDAFFSQACETLTGEVILKLGSGRMRVVSRTSPYSLYDADSVTFDSDDDGIHHLADGYCKIAALRQKQLGVRDLRTERVI